MSVCLSVCLSFFLSVCLCVYLSVFQSFCTLERFDPNTGQNLDFDVSLAHPLSQNIIKRISTENGHSAVAATREDNNMKRSLFQEDMYQDVLLL